MARKANPDADEASDPMMEDLKSVPFVGGGNLPADVADEDVEQEAELAAEDIEEEPVVAGEEEAASRRSRRQRAAERGERKAPVASNLDENPDFREYKSKMDRQLEQERSRRADMERQQADQYAAQARYQAQALQQQINSPDVADDDRARAVDQLAKLGAYNEFQRWQQWQKHVAARVKEAGLDPDEFDATHYSGQAGAVQFERDLAAAEATKAKKELAKVKGELAGVSEQVKREVAKALQAQGMNVVDADQPMRGGTDTDAMQRDIALLQSGRLAPERFAKKWGG